MISYETRQVRWLPEEVKELIRLKQKNTDPVNITVILNDKFKTLRTVKSVNTKWLKLNVNAYNIKVDKIIIANVRKYPANLQLSFEVSAKELNLIKNDNLKPYTKNSVQGRYYSYIRLNYNVISTGSVKEGFTINIKNKARSKELPQPKLTPVMYLLKEILTLSDKDRLLLKELLNS